MKIIKVNSLIILFFVFFISTAFFLLPVIGIEFLWNSTIAKSYNIVLDFSQALILWLMFLVSLYIMGLFKFEFSMAALDNKDIGKHLETLENKIEEIKKSENK